MDRWIELSRLYRSLLRSAPTFEDALGGLRSGGTPGFRRLLDEGTDWSGITSADFSADKQRLLSWYDDILACDLGPGIDILHVELGASPQSFEISTWRWADRIMFIDEGMIEPDSIRTVSSPQRVHLARDLTAPLFRTLPAPAACSEFAAYAIWLLFCSFVPLEALAATDLKSRWSIDREFTALFSFKDPVFHGGFLAPIGWRRPLKPVEVPHH